MAAIVYPEGGSLGECGCARCDRSKTQEIRDIFKEKLVEAIVPFAKTLPELRIAFFGSGYLYGEQKILEAVREALPTQEMHITVIDPIYKEAIGALAEFKADQVCTSYTQVAEMPHVLIALNLEGETAIQEYFFFQVEIEIFHDNSLTVMLQNRDTDSYSIVSTVNGQLSKMDFQL